jgi:hypothetical protein
MRSGSFNVIYITFGDFTLLGHFSQPFEVVAATRNPLQPAFNSP